jgi:hypothetical protein
LADRNRIRVVKQEPVNMLNARSAKIVLVLDSAGVLDLAAPEGQARVKLTIGCGAIRYEAEVAAKSVRKAQAAIRTHGPEGVAALLQGKLVSGLQVAEAGLVVQPKIKPEAKVDEANQSA